MICVHCLCWSEEQTCKGYVQPTTNNTNNTQLSQLTFHLTDFPTWQTEPNIGLGFTQNARQKKLGVLLALKPFLNLVITVIHSPFISHLTERILALLTFHSSLENTQNGCYFMLALYCNTALARVCFYFVDIYLYIVQIYIFCIQLQAQISRSFNCVYCGSGCLLVTRS